MISGPLQVAIAVEVPYLIRSPKALLMGDAFTALADDEYTLFYNPGALGTSKFVHVSPFGTQIGVTNVLSDLDRFLNLPSDMLGWANQFMGYPVSLHFGITPTVKFGPFAFSIFYRNSKLISVMNSTRPLLYIDSKEDRGVIFGYAFQFGSKESQSSFGLSIKQITRKSIETNHALFGIDSISMFDTIGDSDGLEGMLEAIGQTTGEAWGWDVGWKHTFNFTKSKLMLGAAIFDVDKTKFKRTAGTDDISNNEMLMSSGVAWKQDFYWFDYSVSFDVHPVLKDIEWRRKIHMGLEFGIPGFRFFTGYNAGYMSYGGEVNLWIFKLVGGLYDIEIGSAYKDQKSSRAIIYFSFADFAFDV